MNTSYYCKRCNYKTPLFKDMIRHYRKKIICLKNINSYNYSDDQLVVLSLLPYYDNKISIKENEIDDLKDSSLLYNNLENFINYIDNIFKKKNKKCEFCNNDFLTILDLRKHVIMSCYCIEIKKKENLKNNEKSKTEYNISITNNINNINTVNNINITNNFYIDIKPPIPFDSDWDLSKIDANTQLGILFNKLMYSALLEELLKNDTNLNVIIDQNAQSGIVYKNDVDKYTEMKTKDIVNVTMEKLKNHLLEINNNSKNVMLEEEFNTHCRRMINKKFIDYGKEKELHEKTIYCISNIFQQKKDDAVEISKKIVDKI
jgi:hypothetical protein